MTQPHVTEPSLTETPLTPFWAAFALLREQIERLVALNLFWVLLLVPGAIGLAYPSLPLLGRSLLLGLSTLLVIPGSFAVYSVIAQALDSSEITFPETWRTFRRGIGRSFRTLAPLYVPLLGLLWLNVVATPAFPFLLGLRVLLLFGLSASLYWGPLATREPPLSAAQVFRASLTLVFGYPVRTLWTAVVSLLLLLGGAVSIGGLVLIVFVLLASYQTLVFYTLKG